MQKGKARAVVIVLACLMLIVTSIYQQSTNKQDTLSLLQQGEPSAARFEKIEGAYEAYTLYDWSDTLLNYGVISSASGYGGPMTMLTIVSPEGIIIKAVLLDDSETPLYLKKVLAAGYPEVLQGKPVDTSLATYEEVDAVSGATRTTEGMILAVEKGMFQVGKNQLGFVVPQLEIIHFQWQDGLVVIVLLLAILAAARNMKKLRPWILVMTVLVLGFMENSSLTIGNYTSIIALKMPTFMERPIWYVMVVGVFLVTLFWGRNFYCSWLCPFGAVQEGVYKALNLANYQPSPKLISIARKSRWFFLWLAVLLALGFNNPGIASYEPFSVFFDGDGNTSQWIIMLMILLFSIFILRFWCRCFCPMGAFLDFIASCKRKGKQLLQRKSRSEDMAFKMERNQSNSEQSPVFGQNRKGDAEAACAACSGCRIQEQEKPRLSSGDRVVTIGVVVIGLLIMGTLLQNIGLF